jgi:hypothetical protein
MWRMARLYEKRISRRFSVISKAVDDVNKVYMMSAIE